LLGNICLGGKEHNSSMDSGMVIECNEEENHHESSKLKDTSFEEGAYHFQSIEEPENIKGYIALEGKSLVALDLNKKKDKNILNRQIIKPIKKHSVYRTSGSSDGTQRLCFTAGANYEKHPPKANKQNQNEFNGIVPINDIANLEAEGESSPENKNRTFTSKLNDSIKENTMNNIGRISSHDEELTNF
jgi:hypothetical protein